eukprot:9000625-Pyramimonas_sp.AAC.1
MVLIHCYCLFWEAWYRARYARSDRLRLPPRAHGHAPRRSGRSQLKTREARHLAFVDQERSGQCVSFDLAR